MLSPFSFLFVQDCLYMTYSPFASYLCPSVIFPVLVSNILKSLVLYESQVEYVILCWAVKLLDGLCHLLLFIPKTNYLSQNLVFYVNADLNR